MKSLERSCSSKMQLTRAEAQRIVREIRRRGERTHNRKHRMNAYRCGFCGEWHVGHNSAAKWSRYKRVRRIELPEAQNDCV